MKSKFLILISIFGSIAFWSCTDLNESLYDETLDKNVPTSLLVESMYGALRGDMSVTPQYCPFWKNVYNVQCTTDELAVPTCGYGFDWLDGNIYLDLQQHNWDATNPAFAACWSYCFKIISEANNKLKNKDEWNLDEQSVAECRLLRAYGYYRLLDLFGNVPIVDENNDGVVPSNSSRAEVFAWLEKELNDPIMESLKSKRFAKMDKGILHTLKARLYLNSKVFLGLDNESDAYKTYLDKCIEECDAVIESGQYSIEPNIYKNFYSDNSVNRSSENIFQIEYNDNGSTHGNRLQMESYYKTQGQVFVGEMYGHTTGGFKLNPGKTADDPDATFNIFDKNDNRRLSILWGQQYDKNKKTIIIGENPTYINRKPNAVPDTIDYRLFFDTGLDYRVTKPGVLGKVNCARSGDGARIIKFELQENPIDYEPGNDMVVMRYAEVLYMKAECLIRLGRNSESVPLFQEVLQYRGYNYNNIESEAKTPSGGAVTYDFAKDEGKDASWAQAMMSKKWLMPTSLTEIIPASPDLEFMDQELRREFIFEDHRRTDMIRMDKFLTETWGGHLTPTMDENKLIFPIPSTELGKNPNLVQNPGY